MTKSDDTSPPSKSATTQMRAVTEQLREDKIRAEYEAKDHAKLETSVDEQCDRISKLERQMIRANQTIAIIKWAGMTLGGIVASVIVAAILGG